MTYYLLDIHTGSTKPALLYIAIKLWLQKEVIHQSNQPLRAVNKKKKDKQDGKWNPWYKNQQRKSEEKKKDPEGIAILIYGANNNFFST